MSRPLHGEGGEGRRCHSFLYADDVGRGAGTSLHLGLYDLLDLVSENPAAGRLRPELAEGLRSFPYRKHLVFYVFFEGEIVVIRVLGARQEIETGHFAR